MPGDDAWAGDLAPVVGSVAIAELHPGRYDGADLTDWLAQNHDRSMEQRRAMLVQATVTVP
ncbi:MAG: hypothetical protein ACLP8S_03450 [Solirubrobacteraceae bacterium]